MEQLNSFKAGLLGCDMEQKSIVQEESLEGVIEMMKDLIAKAERKIESSFIQKPLLSI